MRDVVIDAERKPVASRESALGARLAQLVQSGLCHCGCEVLRGETVTAADHARHCGARAGREALCERCDDIQIERFASAARLLSLLEHSDGGDGGRNRGKKISRGKRAVEPNLYDADLLAGGDQRLDRLARGFRASPHQDQNAGRVGRAFILEQPVLSSGQFSEAIHRLRQNAGNRGVIGADGLARLKERVGVLRRTADEGMFGIQPAVAVRAHQIVRDHRPHRIVIDEVERVQLVRRAEAVEEMNEGHPCLQRRRFGDQCGVVRLLHIGG